MNKYLVPCVALLGLALLTPRADAVDLFIKARACPPAGHVSIPVYGTNVSANTLWGIDFAAVIDNAALTAYPDANNAFAPEVSSATDVIVTGNTFVGGGTQPNLYVGYVKGLTGFDITKAFGLLKVQVAAGTATKTVINLTVPATYMVKNDGTGNDVSRAGATAVTSTATAGAPVVAETVVVKVNTGAAGELVPLRQVAVLKPGDINGDTNVNANDLNVLKSKLAGKTIPTTVWGAWSPVGADVAPPNGYTAADIGGTAGFGYGDSVVNANDMNVLKAYLATKPGTPFPVPEV